MTSSRAGRGLGAAGLVLTALLALAGPATAHALPQASSPSAGASLSTPPVKVTITFGERPDAKLSSINVLDASGGSVTAGPTAATSADPLTLEVPLKPLTGGVYTVSWRTVSAIDGHRATGSFAFGVGTAPPAAGGPSNPGAVEASSSGASVAAIGGRWLMYLGLLALLGAGFFGVAIARPPALVLRRLLPGAWIVAVVGTAAVLTDQLAEAGVDLPDAFATSFGPAIVERGVPLLIAGLAVAVAARQGGWHRPATAVVAAAAAGALIADVLSSHAAAGRNPTIDIVIQSLHVVAVGLWLGGLVGLLLTVRRQPATALTGRTAKRFSWLATVGIATVAVTGILRAIGEVGSIDGLLSSDFGHLVIAKSGLLGVLALLGAVNHFRNVPAASRVLTGLRRVGTTEILVGGTVLLLSATLVNIAPPSSVAAASASPAPSPTPAPLVVSGSDFGTSVRLALEVSPGLTGFNTFRATVTDYDTGAPVAADGVTLRFSLPARSDVGGSRLDLAPAGAGVFSATGSNLSLDGSWTVTALVARGTASVEVPLQLSIQSTRQPVEVNRVPGIPTIYTVHLSAGRSVQVYLDPDRPGQNDVHVTFFDASGSELPATGIAVSVSTAGAPSRALSVRTLEPGHVVATLTVPATTATFVIVGTAPDGERLQAQLDLTPGA